MRNEGGKAKLVRLHAFVLVRAPSLASLACHHNALRRTTGPVVLRCVLALLGEEKRQLNRIKGIA